jgi:hypothetical protein
LRRRLPSSGTASDRVFEMVPYFKMLLCQKRSRYFERKGFSEALTKRMNLLTAT